MILTAVHAVHAAYLCLLPGAGSSPGHMEKSWSPKAVILLETTSSVVWLGLGEPFPRRLAALSTTRS